MKNASSSHPKAKEAMGRPLTIGLVQINNAFSGQNYLPYSTGVLQAYVEGHAPDPARYRFLVPIFKRERVDAAVEHLIEADVVGFSTYVWNEKISLAIAERLKARKPEIVILFGGPQVPDQSEAFLRRHRFIDAAIHNEGERAFLAFLETLPGRDWTAVPSLSAIDTDGRYVRTLPAPRLRELDEIPSPFLTDVFEPLMEAHPEQAWIGMWETNRGCPFACTFCDWGSATASKVNQFGMDRLEAEIQWFADHKLEFVFCCDANFGILKRDVEIAEHVAKVKKSRGYPKALSVQNTKNATERAYLTQKILSDAGLNKGVTLSMQSMDDPTLEAIKRKNIQLDTYMELQRRFTEDRVETYSDLILGLPGETYDAFCDGIARLIENGQHNRIQFNNLSILPNAEMGDPAYQKRYGMQTVETRIINMHGAPTVDADGIYETQQLVVATAAMPREDWAKTRAYAWLVALLHFDKLFQMPIVATREIAGIGYRQIFDAFMNADRKAYPLLGRIRDFFLAEAQKIQDGGPEYIYSEEWLGIYWPADEYVFIDLTKRDEIGAFTDEAFTLLENLIEDEAFGIPITAIYDAVMLNRALIKQPFLKKNFVLKTGYDMLSFHKAAIVGKAPKPTRQETLYSIDRTTERYTDFGDWCREVVWYGNKKGAYLYGNQAVETHLAGHH
ncbi:MAG: radical SAM protein [Alphaproteobacteria bacterium]|nr:radical SAM protein [Alphaproteobacteria bacterium]